MLSQLVGSSLTTSTNRAIVFAVVLFFLTEQYGGSSSMGGIPRKFSSDVFAENTAARLKADASDSKSDVESTRGFKIPRRYKCRYRIFR